MFTKIFISLGIAVILFLLYLVVKMYNPSWFDFEAEISAFSGKEMPENAPWIQKNAQVEPPRVLSSGGPSTPSMKAMPQEENRQSPDVIPSDPFVEASGSSQIEDSMRHPERMFSPGVQPTNTSSAVMSGVASNETHVSAQALQTFVPEMAQNGGDFMKGIAANDTLGEAEYAAF